MIEIIKKLAKEAGREIAQVQINNNDLNIKLKSNQTPVTLADITANEIITDGLKSNFPHIPILSEEDRIEEYLSRKDWKEYFLIDPLDGTKEFIEDGENYTVNIAYMLNNKPTIGVVYLPTQDKLYYNDDKNAYLEDKNSTKTLPIKKNTDSKYKLATGKSSFNEKCKKFISKLEQDYEIEHMRIASSLKICLIAEGFLDFYPRFGPTSEWDTAAAHAILNKSNGSILQISILEDITYNKEDLLNPFFIALKNDFKDSIAKYLT